MRITILGAGVFGNALGAVLVDNGHEVRYYDPIVHPEVGLEEVVGWAEVLIFAAPSRVAKELLEQIADKDKPLISVSKGFWSLAAFEDFVNFSVVSGGSFAKTLAEKSPVILTASSDLAKNLLQTDWLKIERSNDQLGIVLCGTLKNIYAIGAGERALKANTADFRAYIADCLTEMKYILAANECDPQTAELSCGKLDLIITCGSKESRNYQLGRKLKQRNHLELADIKETTEGLNAILQLQDADLAVPEDCQMIEDIIQKVQNATK